MQYQGGKWKLRKEISTVINSYGADKYLEPFVGSCSILPLVDAKLRIGGDYNHALITMLAALRDGWKPPSERIRYAEYKYYATFRDKGDPMTAFVGFGCSFGGKYFGGYARNKEWSNYAKRARDKLLKVQSDMRDTDKFLCADYQACVPSGFVIYCDPPYHGTLDYAQTNFDSAAFWAWVIAASRNNVVLVSEYRAPRGFTCVASWDHRSYTSGSRRTTEGLWAYGAG